MCANVFWNRWEKDQYFKAEKYQEEIQRSQRPEAANEPNKTEREEYAKEAKELLAGTKTWRPTWQALGLNYDRSIFRAGKNSTSTSS